MESRNVTVLYTADEIRERVKSLAKEISERMPSNLMIVSLLRGSFMFTSDLVRELYHTGMHPQIDFMTLSSYGKNIKSGPKVQLNRDITEDVAGRHVLIVDDILESGKSIAFAKNLVVERGAMNIKVCVLLEKPGKREIPIDADFRGFMIPDKFVVGYGLDYANYYRELPYVGFIDIH
jgi:hypoxanthine phosphoribosyltransferase